MIQHNFLNVRLSSNAIGDSSDETYFTHDLFLTDRQALILRKAVSNNLPAKT